MRPNIPDLATIQRRAAQNAFELDQAAWGQGVDRERQWFPERFTPLAHCEVYQELRPEERRTYNQLYAQATNEQFILLEEGFLIRFAARMLATNRLPAELQEALVGFVEEEVKHTEMFRRLNRLADPERYAKRDFSFVQVGRAEEWGLELMSRHPQLFAFWCWGALIFEEKTVDYYRQYQRHAREQADAPLDPLHEEIHRLHALDEVRHVQIDMHLIQHIYDPRGSWVRGLNSRVIRRLLGAYTRPKRAGQRLVEELCRLHPRLADRLPAMRSQLLALGQEWQALTYSRKNAPQTFSMFDAYPEFHSLSRVLLCYDPPREALPSAA